MSAMNTQQADFLAHEISELFSLKKDSEAIERLATELEAAFKRKVHGDHWKESKTVTNLPLTWTSFFISQPSSDVETGVQRWFKEKHNVDIRFDWVTREARSHPTSDEKAKAQEQRREQREAIFAACEDKFHFKFAELGPEERRRAQRNAISAAYDEIHSKLNRDRIQVSHVSDEAVFTAGAATDPKPAKGKTLGQDWLDDTCEDGVVEWIKDKLASHKKGKTDSWKRREIVEPWPFDASDCTMEQRISVMKRFAKQQIDMTWDPSRETVCMVPIEKVDMDPWDNDDDAPEPVD